MYLITAELAGLLAQILPVFIVLLVLEQSKFNAVHTLQHVPIKDRAVARGAISGWRLALLSLNVVSVVLCLVVVQLGDQGFKDLNQAASLTNRGFLSALVVSTVIYASTLCILIFFTILAWRIAFTDIISGHEFKDAIKAPSPTN